MSSAVTAAMLATHRALSTWRNQVDLYIAPSRFCRDKFVEAGFAADRITIKPGFVYPDGGMGSHDGRYWLFVGRLSEEKGLDILIDAWRELGPAFPLKIVGDGPLLPLVAAACRDMPWIEHIGHQPPAEVQRLMGQAQALVFPCQAYTTFGLVVVEAFAKGTPAIVPETGALAELVEHGRNGFRFDARSPWALAAVVRESVSRPPSLAEMRCAARAEFLAKYTAEANMKTLAGIYRLAIALSRRAATAAKS